MSLLRTGYLDSPAGGLHLTLHLPEGLHSTAWILHVPAFGEEMNKSRHLVASQGRCLAQAGAAVIIPDLTGTGDSAGTLDQADWTAWQDDLERVAAWAASQGAKTLVLWGLRLGCLLAADIVGRLPLPVAALWCWQPVPAGKQHIKQFLRLRAMAGLTGGKGESVVQLRSTLEQEGSLEVAGYPLGEPLVASIEERELSSMALPGGLPVRLVEVVSDVSRPLSPLASRQLEAWNAAGIAALGAVVRGDPFWTTQELGFAPELLEHTLGWWRELHHPVGEEPNAGGSPETAAGLSAQAAMGWRTTVFDCGEYPLAGIVHGADTPSDLGVVIVVGGPQYRVGSHRQFVSLADALAGAGFPTLRFDYRGMGDSAGELAGFTGVEEDIRAAIDALQTRCPAVERVLLGGLCDAATAAVFYAHRDRRVKGLILANPWVYSPQGQAKAYLRHYYLQRLLSRNFWTKVFSGSFSPRASLESLRRLLRTARGGQDPGEELPASPALDSPVAPTVAPAMDLAQRFASGLARFSGRRLLLISGRDLTATEFVAASQTNRALRRQLAAAETTLINLPAADHTFSTSAATREMEQACVKFAKAVL
tara:strand:- start:32736 stop:34514 length:1779 start_codon:yes stop_codon:yes gene_type:complete